MVYENIETEIKDEVLIASMKRPEKLNAISHQMRVDLLDCVGVSAMASAIVITGNGQPSPPANIQELKEGHDHRNRARCRFAQGITTVIGD